VTAATGLSAALEDFDALVAANGRRVYRLLFAILRDDDAAETLTQECFLRAYETRESFRGDCSASTWLVRIAVNLARDRVRNRRAEFWRRLVGIGNRDEESSLQAMPDVHASPEMSAIAREQVTAVFAALDDLTAQQRTAFVLRFVEEMSVEEIGDAMSLRVGTVKSHLFRAVGAVRKKLKEQSKK
jgi:RNA polymerase sigma-70 factor, ECF subfamily